MATYKKVITNINDIEHLVDQFYTKIRNDELLKDIFNSVIQDRWPDHLKKMVCFWQTVLLKEHTYFGSPFIPHAQLPLEKIHFDQWLKLFKKTVDENFTGEKAIKAKWQGERMAEMFQHKIEYYKNNTAKPIL